jgi:hypothetical protein
MLDISVTLEQKTLETLAKSAHKDSTALLVLRCPPDVLTHSTGVVLAQRTFPSVDLVLPGIIAWRTTQSFECVHRATSVPIKLLSLFPAR